MRADLFQAVLLVGAGHNRWHVMEAAASMVQAAQDANDVAGFTRVLKEHPVKRGTFRATSLAPPSSIRGCGIPQAGVGMKGQPFFPIYKKAPARTGSELIEQFSEQMLK
jgi:hypothetical protein